MKDDHLKTATFLDSVRFYMILIASQMCQQRMLEGHRRQGLGKGLLPFYPTYYFSIISLATPSPKPCPGSAID